MKEIAAPSCGLVRNDTRFLGVRKLDGRREGQDPPLQVCFLNPFADPWMDTQRRKHPGSYRGDSYFYLPVSRSRSSRFFRLFMVCTARSMI